MVQDYSLVAPGRSLRLLTVVLGMLASSISICVSAMAGWQRGSVEDERLLLAAVGVMAVLGAHLLPALWRQAKSLVRIFGFGLWLACGFFVAYGHTSYYLAALDQAGARRASAFERAPLKTPQPPKRLLSAVLVDEAKLRSTLAAMAQVECFEGCPVLRARESALKARILATEAEADETRRWQLAQDRLVERRAELQDEPAVVQLAARLGVSAGAVNLVTGGIFSVILEGIGSLCWYLVFLRHDPVASLTVLQAVKEGVTDDSVADLTVTADEELESELDQIVAKVRREIKAGRLACTVAAIRLRLACSQRRASEVRRLVLEATQQNSDVPVACTK